MEESKVYMIINVVIVVFGLLAAIHYEQQAYHTGLDEGYESGYEIGYSEGYAEALKDYSIDN